jgi:large conductance mechanosensitive channel
MLKEFKAFAMRGNVIDLAIGVVIGAAFGKIITSFVGDVLMPPISMLLGKADFSSLFFDLSGTKHATLAEAKAAAAPTINYGAFLSTVVDFIIIAFVLFLIVRQVNRFQAPKTVVEAPKMKECPQCLSSIPALAVRCGHCTSALAPAAV